MIAVDWGTSSFRAYRLAPGGAVLDRRDAPRGIMQVEGGRFAGVLRDAVGPWLAEGEGRVLLCGMIGSRQGWVEAPYLACPAGLDELAAGLVAVPFEGASVRLVPGLRHADEHGVPEVMRGEEVQIMGALAGSSAGRRADGLVCLPGTHSKWARVRAGRVEGFATHMTGEAFAALRGHTILGRMMRDGPADPAAFLRGVERSGQPGGLLHHLFGVRTLGLFGELAETDAADYLSGLLIGHELRAAMPGAGPEAAPDAGEGAGEVHLIGAPALCALYGRAIVARGGRAVAGDPDAAARGLHLIGSRAAWN